MEKNFQLFDLVRTGLWCFSYLMSQYSIRSVRHLIYTCGSMARTYSGCRAIALRDIGEGKCNSIASLNVATNLVFINKSLNIIRVLCSIDGKRWPIKYLCVVIKRHIIML